MFPGSSDPCIDYGIADDVRNTIEVALLSGLVGMVEIELVHKLIKRDGKIGLPCLRDLGNFGQGLRAGHNRVQSRLRFGLYPPCKLAQAQLGGKRKLLVGEEPSVNVSKTFNGRCATCGAPLHRILEIAIIGGRPLQGIELHCQNIGGLSRYYA